jgi:hypothetical protein
MKSVACLLSRAVAVMLVGAAVLAHAGPERDRIAAERAEAVARFAEAERACSHRFVVTSCVNAARKEQRATLTRLRHAELALDDAERREASAQRHRELEERAAAQDAGPREPSSAPHRAVERSAPEPNPAVARPQRSAFTAAERRTLERRNETQFEARARAAREHRESVNRRNAQRMNEGKAAAPLPVPSGASAP